MKPQTEQRLKLSLAKLIRTTLASTWLWKQPAMLPLAEQRRKLRRAASKAKADPTILLEDLGFNLPIKTAFPEHAAVALAEMLELLAAAEEREDGMQELVSSEQNERRIVRLLLAFFGALVARPGRPRLDQYRQAADLFRDGKSFHELCLELKPEYSTSSKEQQRKMRDAMRAGVLRFGRRVSMKPPQ
jgi:hypothetical protein